MYNNRYGRFASYGNFGLVKLEENGKFDGAMIGEQFYGIDCQPNQPCVLLHEEGDDKDVSIGDGTKSVSGFYIPPPSLAASQGSASQGSTARAGARTPNSGGQDMTRMLAIGGISLGVILIILYTLKS